MELKNSAYVADAHDLHTGNTVSMIISSDLKFAEKNFIVLKELTDANPDSPHFLKVLAFGIIKQFEMLWSYTVTEKQGVSFDKLDSLNLMQVLNLGI